MDVFEEATDLLLEAGWSFYEGYYFKKADPAQTIRIFSDTHLYLFNKWGEQVAETHLSFHDDIRTALARIGAI